MEKIEKLNLIEGNFSEEEAKEVLLKVYSSKINFHEMKNFSTQVKTGKEDEVAKKKILELKKETEKVLQIVDDAKLNNKRLIITSEIIISLSDQ